MERAGSLSGDSPKRSRSEMRRSIRLRGACGLGARPPRSRAASGLRPGTLRPPARSWLTLVVGSFAGHDARPGMGRYRSPALRELTHDPRKARPDAVNLPRMSEQRLDTGLRANAAMERRKARRPRYGRSSLARTCRRWALSRDGPRVRPDHAHQRLPALHLPSVLSRMMKRDKAPARAPPQAGGAALAEPHRNSHDPQIVEQ